MGSLSFARSEVHGHGFVDMRVGDEEALKPRLLAGRPSVADLFLLTAGPR